MCRGRNGERWLRGGFWGRRLVERGGREGREDRDFVREIQEQDVGKRREEREEIRIMNVHGKSIELRARSASSAMSFTYNPSSGPLECCFFNKKGIRFRRRHMY